MCRLFLAFFLLVLSSPSQPQLAPEQAQTNAPSLDWMIGNWEGEGTFMGRPSHVSLSVSYILGGNAVSLDYTVSVRNDGEKRTKIFAGHGFYRLSSGKRLDGRWIDDAGNLHDLNGRVDPTSLSVVWGSPGTEIGRTVYALDGSTMMLTDQVLKRTGALDIFAVSRLSKK